MAFSINESILIIFVVNMLRVLQKCTPSGLYLTMLVSSIITFVPISSCLKFSGWKIEYATPNYRLTCIGIRVILSWYFCKTLDTGKSGEKKKSRSYSLVSKTSACKGFLLTVPEREGMLQWLLLHNHTPVPLWDRNQLQLSKFQEEAVKRNNNNNCLETTRPKIAEDLTSVDFEPHYKHIVIH